MVTLGFIHIALAAIFGFLAMAVLLYFVSRIIINIVAWLFGGK